MTRCSAGGDGGRLTDGSGTVRPAEPFTTVRGRPVVRNTSYPAGRDPTDETTITHYNNFYEFTTYKDFVWDYVGDFVTEPWTVEIAGLCDRPGVYDLDSLLTDEVLEERIYRHRCVETWAMTIPWVGIPFSRLASRVQPQSRATHVRMVTTQQPEAMPGIGELGRFPWPYVEGLRMDEAMNDLTFLAVGLYGNKLPAQNGAPLRLVVPWKWGFKSIKSIVKIEFIDYQPETFWPKINGRWYDFESNVRPDNATVSWLQATEWVMPDGPEVETLPYNGYGEWVAHLYR